jgi:hypothetical protein
MSTRRNLMKMLGLGSLFAAGAATMNQARATKGMAPLPPGDGPGLENIPEWCRPKFPPYARTRWEHRVVSLCMYERPFPDVAAVINHETEDGSELVSTYGSGWLNLVFRKRVLWSA